MTDTARLESWTYDAPEGFLIWKLLISPAGIIAGEERGPEAKLVTFFALDLETRRPLFRGKELHEPWWLAAQAASSTHFYVSQFPKPDMPESSGIVALDIVTGEERWHNRDLSFVVESEGRVIARRSSPLRTRYMILDPDSGEPVGEVDEAFLRALDRNMPADERSRFPDTLSPESPHAIPLLDYLKSHDIPLEELRGGLEWLAFDDVVIWAFYYRQRTARGMLENLLTERIVVFHRDVCVYEDIVEPETQLPVPNTYFVYDHNLIYVRNKQAVVIVRLP